VGAEDWILRSGEWVLMIEDVWRPFSFSFSFWNFLDVAIAQPILIWAEALVLNIIYITLRRPNFE
jgi:hypothetical protein